MDVPLAKWFERPIVIANVAWAQGADLNVVLDPWSLFFANAAVVNRLSNFNLLRCRLCVKFVLTGNPFLYGLCMAQYLPFASTISTTSAAMSTLAPFGTLVPEEMVVASQRDHVMLKPGDSTEGVLSYHSFLIRIGLVFPMELGRELEE
jgi:hypothetical protein